MKTALIVIVALLVWSIAPPAKADTMIVNSTLFFLPVADDSPDLLNFGVQYSLTGSAEILGFMLPSDPFTMSNGEMTFIPGAYDNGYFTITDPPADATDTFTFYRGAYSFTLPSTVTPFADTNDNFLWIDNVPLAITMAPEPGTLPFLGLGLAALAIAAARRRRLPV